MRLSALLITNPSRSIFSVAPKSSDCADCQIFIVCWWRSCVCLLLCRLVLLPSISYDFFPVSFLTILPCARSLSLLHRIWLTFGSSGTNLVTCDNCFGFLSLLLLSIHAFFSFAFNCIQLHSIIPRFSWYFYGSLLKKCSFICYHMLHAFDWMFICRYTIQHNSWFFISILRHLIHFAFLKTVSWPIICPTSFDFIWFV